MKSRKPRWWKTYDYDSGHTYILGKKFVEKREAMSYAISCGMMVIGKSTVPITDDQYKIAILENQLKEKKIVR